MQLNVKFTMKGTTPLHLTRATLVVSGAGRHQPKEGWDVWVGNCQGRQGMVGLDALGSACSTRAASGKPDDVLPVGVRKAWAEERCHLTLAKAIRWRRTPLSGR